MRRVTSTDLANWASSRSSQGDLPLLIRGLIRTAPVQILSLLIPVGDNVNIPGFDGTLETVDGTDYIPTGKSVWEIGTGKDYEEKARKEFRKRSSQITNINKAETTFVFVTPHIWRDKETWIEDRKRENIWLDVKVIDGLALEEWIEQYPSMSIKFAKMLSLPTGNVRSLDEFWEEWSKSIKYKISEELVLSGRNNEIQQLLDVFNSEPISISVKAATLEESIAFLGAAVNSWDENLKEEIFSKCLIIEREEDFRNLISTNPLILCPLFAAGSLIDKAVMNGHHVIIPSDLGVTALQNSITLSRVRRNGFEQSLINMGFTSAEAEQLTRDSGQSFSVLRRLLAFDKNIQPLWARNGNHLEIIPALLVGRWDDENIEDQSAISKLYGESYEKFMANTSRWKIERDPPLISVQSIWQLTSALDAWSILAPFLSKIHLNRFREVFLEVMHEVNTKASTSSSHRFYSGNSKYSHFLNEGLCQSLVLMAVFGERFQLSAVDSPQNFANGLVYELLNNATGKLWCSLSRYLPLIAEAAPESFLNSVENSLKGEESAVMKMFGENSNSFSGANYYTGLLWAIEGLMASEDYIMKATLLLGQLARLDPGGRLSNRPINSLIAAYVAWYGQTWANISIKKKVLEVLAQNEPQIAWELFLNIAPGGKSTVSPIHRCRWRFDTQHLERTMSYAEIFDFYSFLIEHLMSFAKDDQDKLGLLLEMFPKFKPEERIKYLVSLKSHAEETTGYQSGIWNTIRKFLSRHREHFDAQWALPEADLKELEVIFNMLSPNDPKEKFRYLFEEDWPLFPEGNGIKEKDHNERRGFADQKRKAAFSEIYGAEGLSGILEYGKVLKSNFQLARIAAAYPLSKKEEQNIMELLDDKIIDANTMFAQHYIKNKPLDISNDWVTENYQFLSEKYSDPEVIALYFLNLPPTRKNWELLATKDSEAEKIYWKKVTLYYYDNEISNLLFAVRKLQSVNKHAAVLDLISQSIDDLSSEFIAECLNNACDVASEHNRNEHLDNYYIGKMFEILHSRKDLDEEQIANLEWIYLPFLNHYEGEVRPTTLLKKLNEKPDFFIELINLAYAYRDQNDIELSEKELTERYLKSNTANNLLDMWRLIPGTRIDGTIDGTILNAWMQKARSISVSENKRYFVDMEIGQMLARYPKNNTAWPPDEICHIIDSINSEALSGNFETQIINGRGMTVRAAYEGGDQEKNLAAYYLKMSKRIQHLYPITALILRNLSKRYEYDAKEEDNSAHLDELR